MAEWQLIVGFVGCFVSGWLISAALYFTKNRDMQARVMELEAVIFDTKRLDK